MERAKTEGNTQAARIKQKQATKSVSEYGTRGQHTARGRDTEIDEAHNGGGEAHHWQEP